MEDMLAHLMSDLTDLLGGDLDLVGLLASVADQCVGSLGVAGAGVMLVAPAGAPQAWAAQLTAGTGAIGVTTGPRGPRRPLCCAPPDRRREHARYCECSTRMMQLPVSTTTEDSDACYMIRSQVIANRFRKSPPSIRGGAAPGRKEQEIPRFGWCGPLEDPASVGGPARRTIGPLALVVATAAILFVASGGTAEASSAPIDLGSATSFAVLASTGISNSGTTTLTGDVGTSPSTTISGGTLQVTGTTHSDDAVARAAEVDLHTAYGDAANEGPATSIASELGGQTLSPGVYAASTSFDINGTLTLDGGGNPNAVFVLQTGADLTTVADSHIALAGAAQACNVFWQLGGSATLGNDASVAGTVMAQTDITANAGGVVDGRLLSLGGAVSLSSDTVSVPSCAGPPPTTTTTTTTTTQPQVLPAVGVPESGKIVPRSPAVPVASPAKVAPVTTTTARPTTTTTTTTSAPPARVTPGPGAIEPKRALGGGGIAHCGNCSSGSGAGTWLIVGGSILALSALFYGGFRFRRRRMSL